MSPVRRRSGYFNRKKLRRILSGIVMLPVVVVAACICLLGWNGYHSVYIQPKVYAPPPPQYFRAARKIYPFSIIPGGVYEPKELAQNLQLDPSLREHYGDVRMENLIAVRTQEPMQGYVSYRNDGKISWTSKRLTIPRGELILTDGQHMIRSRCGNRIQQKNPGGVVSSSAITEQMQDLILDAPLPSIAKLPPPLQPVLSPGVLAGDIWKMPAAEVTTTPEPGTLMLFASGLLLIFMRTVSRI